LNEHVSADQKKNDANSADEDSSSSSYEDDEEIRDDADEDHDDQSESSSERYGIMDTNYACDPMTIDDYELNTNERSNQVDTSRSKVHEWRQRNRSQSLDSSTSSLEQSSSIPATAENTMI
jgi:hypothetical protein